MHVNLEVTAGAVFSCRERFAGSSEYNVCSEKMDESAVERD